MGAIMAPVYPSTKGAIPVYATLLCIYFPASIIANYIFWNRRHLHPIKGRGSFLALISSILSLTWITFSSLHHLLSSNVGWPCFLMAIEGHFIVPVCFICYFIRAITLWHHFEITDCQLQEIDGTTDENTMYWLKRINRVKTPFQLKFLAVGATVHIIQTLIAIFAWGRICSNTGTSVLGGIVVLTYGVGFLYCANRLRKHGQDGLKYKQEMILGGIIIVSLASPWFIYSLLEAGDRFEINVFPLNTIFPTIGFWLSLMISIMYPIKLSYIHQHTPLMATFKKNRSPSISYSTNSKRNMKLFNRMLRKPQARRRFKEFLATEFSVENLCFWESIQNFKKTGNDDAADLYKRARYIAKRFVVEDAILEINIPWQIKGDILTALGLDRYYQVYDDSGSVEMQERAPKKQLTARQLLNIFDRAADDIFSLMLRDSFRRFIRSDLFHDSDDEEDSDEEDSDEPEDETLGQNKQEELARDI